MVIDSGEMDPFERKKLVTETCGSPSNTGVVDSVDVAEEADHFIAQLEADVVQLLDEALAAELEGQGSDTIAVVEADTDAEAADETRVLEDVPEVDGAFFAKRVMNGGTRTEPGLDVESEMDQTPASLQTAPAEVKRVFRSVGYEVMWGASISFDGETRIVMRGGRRLEKLDNDPATVLGVVMAVSPTMNIKGLLGTLLELGMQIDTGKLMRCIGLLESELNTSRAKKDRIVFGPADRGGFELCVKSARKLPSDLMRQFLLDMGFDPDRVERVVAEFGHAGR